MPKPKLSVCLLALNEEENISSTLDSIKDIAQEIIVVVDNLTTDDTAKIASQYTKNVFVQPHLKNFHINKQFALEKATQPWILWLDADEKVPPELAEEISQTLEQPELDGYSLPRKNIIFGKWLQYGGWYPDYQLRLFKKGKGKYPCRKIHENPEVDGRIGYLKNPLIHFNYQNISQYIDKLNRYTTLDAKNIDKEIDTVQSKHLIIRSTDEFIKRFLALEGYKDGFHGLVVSLLQTFYELVVAIKVWELKKFNHQEKPNLIFQVENELKSTVRPWRWWKRELQIQNTKDYFSKIIYKSLRRLGI